MNLISTKEAHLVSATLERLGGLPEDITPLIFERYIQQHPESSKLFRVIAPNQPPQGCGQMLFEILSVSTDAANQETYIDSYLRDLISGHIGFGVGSLDLYIGFLNAVEETIAERLKDNWPEEEKLAWTKSTQILASNIASISDSIFNSKK